MQSNSLRDAAAAVQLAENCIHLAREGHMSSHARTADFFKNAATDPAFSNGFVLAVHNVTTPSDVHYPTWEMHPEGDELLVSISGSLSVEYREDNEVRTVPLPTLSAFVVKAGLWHRLFVAAPSVLMSITPRHNTVHDER